MNWSAIAAWLAKTLTAALSAGALGYASTGTWQGAAAAAVAAVIGYHAPSPLAAK